ncbi:MAG: hypothetical protein P1U63_11515 [Coxiellaceae bacterium]|nr:hypothetical protein [Coxiellaceae bacterium]
MPDRIATRTEIANDESDRTCAMTCAGIIVGVASGYLIARAIIGIDNPFSQNNDKGEDIGFMFSMMIGALPGFAAAGIAACVQSSCSRVYYPYGCSPRYYIDSPRRDIEAADSSTLNDTLLQPSSSQ